MAGNTTEDSSNRKVTIFRTLWLEHHCLRDFNHVRICYTKRGQNGRGSLLLASCFWVAWTRRSFECIVCLSWFVFQGRKSTAKALHHCQQLHLADTGKQYRNIPVCYFSELMWINLTRTMISSDDFLKLAGTARHLEMLNIESCSQISEDAIFKAKSSLPDQLSVLVVACLCSCSSFRDIRARGIRLQAKELLFLTRTCFFLFPREVITLWMH